jgi:signal transduction histidine kinase
MFKAEFGLRGRVLTIALVPSLALLVGGVGTAGYLIEQGLHAKKWASSISGSDAAGDDFTGALQTERELTALYLAGDSEVRGDLAVARQHVDAALLTMQRLPNPMATIDPAEWAQSLAVYPPLLARLPGMRAQVDAGAVGPKDAFAYYSRLTSLGTAGMDAIERTAPDARTSIEESRARALFSLTESMTSTVALGAPAVVRGSLDPVGSAQFAAAVGYSRGTAERLATALPAQPAAQLRAMMAGPAWQQLGGIQDTVIRRGTDPGHGTDARAWQDDAAVVGDQLLSLYESEQKAATAIAGEAANRAATDSMLGGAGALGVSIAAFAVALWLSDRLVRRLRRLRQQALALADHRLPAIMGRIRAGEQVDLAAELSPLDHGDDEIGQVGTAFNRAERAAVEAAVNEAKTREGVRAVFLNIAHRSQLVVHRQLEVLDNAEYRTADPRQLAMLFQLDHLATRERRNAENLIILGGERPGRRWRGSVRLVDLVRSAVAETEDYTKVRLVRMPEVFVIGAVVADLIHLLAELVDNATSFSPPEARVEVRGAVLDHGVTVEITDQGIGMADDDIATANEALSNPPDLSVGSLSSDSRLGLFVVATLAGRHHLSVQLTESVYGGIRAIVVVPSALLTTEPPGAATDLDRLDRDALRRVRPVDEPRPEHPFAVESAAEPAGSRPALPQRGHDLHPTDIPLR